MSLRENERFEESKQEAKEELIQLWNTWFQKGWISLGELERLTGTADF